MTTSLILDCDPGHDDAFAIALAVASPEVRLLGVTAVSGNQTVDKTTANALRVLDHLGRTDIPVAAGADRPLVRTRFVASEVHGETGLDGALHLPPPVRSPEPQHAIDWIARTVAAAPGEVTIVTLGPLTNVALFLARYPGLEQHVARIVMLGGSIGEGNMTPAAEFNVWSDPEAAHRVCSSGIDLTMVGLDVTHQVLFTAEHASRWARAGSIAELFANLYTYYAAFYQRQYGWAQVPLHDALAVAHVIDDTLLETKRTAVVVDTGSELSRGRTYVDIWGDAGWEPNCHVAVKVDASRAIQLVLERLESFGTVNRPRSRRHGLPCV